ncbi:cephalosporin deacetylase [Bacteroidia bacterium]|nr:cephalosporin deacetylase [Bacteroidia bacterium]GHT46371.1 cephalosporin deacetylase [Bacteroidia bacterium]
MRKVFLCISCLLCTISLLAQPSQTLYTVAVQPDKANWIYKVGEQAEFTISVQKNKVALNNITVECEYGPEAFPAVKKISLDIKNASASFKVPGLKTPGFQTVRATFKVDGKTYSSYTNIGYEPEKIQPTQTMPADFQEFWNKALADAEKIPLQPLLTLQPELCTPTLNVYHIRFQNYAWGSYIYGMLCVPKKPGKYPAVLQVPGAGLHSFSGYKSLADKGVITLEIGIHGIPVNLPQQLYSDLANTALNGYAQYNLDNKDKYYFKRVFVGCKRAIDFLLSLEESDGQTVAVMGGSQGGALSIITAALDPRVKCFASRHPGMCDLTGFLNGRPGGWPSLKNNPNIALQLETSQYYDVVNFARILKVPGYYTWGLNDTACYPTTTFSAYNVVNAEKTLNVFAETAHWHFPEQNAAFENWILGRLGVK